MRFRGASMRATFSASFEVRPVWPRFFGPPHLERAFGLGSISLTSSSSNPPREGMRTTRAHRRQSRPPVTNAPADPHDRSVQLRLSPSRGHPRHRWHFTRPPRRVTFMCGRVSPRAHHFPSSSSQCWSFGERGSNDWLYLPLSFKAQSTARQRSTASTPSPFRAVLKVDSSERGRIPNSSSRRNRPTVTLPHDFHSPFDPSLRPRDLWDVQRRPGFQVRKCPCDTAAHGVLLKAARWSSRHCDAKVKPERA